MLTVICFITMAICIASDSYKSSMDNNSVVSRIQVLISFVFAGYITIVINRWDRIRNTTLAQMWGAIENLNMFAYRALTPENEETEKLKDLILRLTRLTFQLTFLAAQGEADLTVIVEQGLVTEKEKVWLEDCAVGTRPLIVVNWVYKYFDVLREKGYSFSQPTEWQIATNMQNMRYEITTSLTLL
jgi:hypothetical protein